MMIKNTLMTVQGVGIHLPGLGRQSIYKGSRKSNLEMLSSAYFTTGVNFCVIPVETQTNLRVEPFSIVECVLRSGVR